MIFRGVRTLGLVAILSILPFLAFGSGGYETRASRCALQLLQKARPALDRVLSVLSAARSKGNLQIFPQYYESLAEAEREGRLILLPGEFKGEAQAGINGEPVIPMVFDRSPAAVAAVEALLDRDPPAVDPRWIEVGLSNGYLTRKSNLLRLAKPYWVEMTIKLTDGTWFDMGFRCGDCL